MRSIKGEKMADNTLPTPTSNDVPSTDIRDHVYAGAMLDKAMTGTALTYTDRKGGEHDTWPGIEKKSADKLSELDNIITSLDTANFTFSITSSDPDGTIAGLAATSNGQFFRVAQGSGADLAFIYYRNANGTAVQVAAVVSAAYVESVRDLAKSVDDRTDGINSTEDSLYPYELVDKAGKGLHIIENTGINNFPGGVKTPNINTQSDDGDSYPYAEVDSSGRVLFATEPNSGRKVYLGEPLHNHRGPLPGDFFAIGDSITAYGVASSSANNGGTSYSPCLNAQSWHTWAMLISNGRLRLTGISATGGYTVTQILNNHLSNALAAKPTFCVVMGGRNDVVQGIDIDTVTIPAFKKIFLALRQKGIIPVVCIMSAQGNSANNTRRIAEHKINNWLRAYARKYQLPLVDLHRDTVDPATGDWIAGYNQDVSHPTGVGARVMGQALVDGLLEWSATTWPPRADEQVSAGLTANLLSNSLFLTNDGQNPTDWTIDTAGTATVTQDPGIKGNAWSMANQTASLTVGATPGDRLQLGFFMKTAGSTLFECYALAGDSTSTTHLAGIRGWVTPTEGWGYFCYEFTVPSGITTITLKTNAGASVCSIAQIGLIKITEI